MNKNNLNFNLNSQNLNNNDNKNFLFFQNKFNTNSLYDLSQLNLTQSLNTSQLNISSNGINVVNPINNLNNINQQNANNNNNNNNNNIFIRNQFPNYKTVCIPNSLTFNINNPNIQNNIILQQNNIINYPIMNINNNNNNFLLNQHSISKNKVKRFNTVQIKSKQNAINYHMEGFLNELDNYLSNEGNITLQIYKSIKNKLLIIIKTQMGSRILQNYLPNTNNIIIHQIFLEIHEHLQSLLLDPYANYFCLNLFSLLNQNDRMIFLSIIVKNIFLFSINKISTYPIQFIVEHLETKNEKQMIITYINQYLLKLALDIYGTHVLEKIITCFEYEYCEKIFDFVKENFVLLSNHVNGLCLIKKLLIISYQKNYYLIFKDILKTNLFKLIENPYGNYALQIVIDYWNSKDVLDIFSQIIGNCSQFSMLKYSSNVIERCLEKNENILYYFIKETCFDKKTIGQLIKNSFGNYVIQTALKNSKGNIKNSLINCIEKNLGVLEEKKLINKWKCILMNSKLNNNNNNNSNKNNNINNDNNNNNNDNNNNVIKNSNINNDNNSN